MVALKSFLESCCKKVKVLAPFQIQNGKHTCLSMLEGENCR